jgi:hypothetical protein
MKRFYISPVVGTGTKDDPYRAKIAGTGHPYAAIIPSNPDGTPASTWCLVIAGGANHTDLDADGEIDKFPDITLDATLGTLTANERNRVLNFLSNKGVDTQGLNTSSTFRVVLERVGAHLEPRFSTNAFDVRDQ